MSVRRQRANFLVATSVTSSSVCSPSRVHYKLLDYSYQFFSISFVGVARSRKIASMLVLVSNFGKFDMHEYILMCRVCTASYVILLIRAMNWCSTVLRKRVGSCVDAGKVIVLNGNALYLDHSDSSFVTYLSDAVVTIYYWSLT